MKNIKNHLFLIAIALMLALQSCERKESYVRILPHPFDRHSEAECHFMAFPGSSPEDYIIDGLLVGYVFNMKTFSATYKKGVLDGPFTEYSGIHTIFTEYNVSNGVKNGYYKSSLRDGQTISGNYSDNKMSGDWSYFDKDSSLVATFHFENGNNASIIGKWKSSSGSFNEFLQDGVYVQTDGDKELNGKYKFVDDFIVLSLNGGDEYYNRIINFSSDKFIFKGAGHMECGLSGCGLIDVDGIEYTLTRL
jgi:hypothetical protein